MPFLILSFFTSLLLTLFVIKSSGTHSRHTADSDLTGPQKFHSRPVPRIGGVSVFIALLVSNFYALYVQPQDSLLMWWLLGSSVPTFAAGFAEDLTKNVSPRRRLVFTAVSALLATWVVDAVIRRTGIPGVDALFAITPVAVALTVFAVTGVANAVNIIDGFNGLASMCVFMMLLAITYVAVQVNDTAITTAALIAAGAMLGFFVWNFPAGLIFLGDGGAYLMGFLLAELSVLLLHRNDSVSPIFPLLLCAYPIFETVFSIYRKKFLRKMSPGVPDGIHLHMLVYKRLMRWAVGTHEARRKTHRNSMTSPYLWILCLLSVVPAVLWWNSTAILSAFLALFVISYVLLYWSIVRFKAPKWLVFRR